MICNEPSLNSMKICKEKKLMENVVTKIMQERYNSKVLHLHNQNFKEQIFKLWVNLEDKIVRETLIQSSEVEIQDLRHKIKMSHSEHVQCK